MSNLNKQKWWEESNCKSEWMESITGLEQGQVGVTDGAQSMMDSLMPTSVNGRNLAKFQAKYSD